MNVESLIAEIKEEFKQYDSAGLIDDASLLRWANKGLKRFGQSIATRQDTIVQVSHGQATLPAGFHSLHMALKCSGKGYYCKEESIPVLQNSLMWKERIERKQSWNSCAPCCKEECETVITENVYINDAQMTFYYDSPQLLKLGKQTKRDVCAKGCRNLAVVDSEYEININNLTMFTNFDEGSVYIEFYGLEMEDGFPLIPETPRGELDTYIEYYLKMRLLEVLLTNKDDANLATLFQYYVRKEGTQFGLAMSDAKFSTLTPDSYRKLAVSNKLRLMRQEITIPKLF